MYYFILHYILSYITLYICLACLTAGVAMFSQNPSVEAAGMDAQPLGHQIPEASRVQVGPAADDAVLGQAAQLPGHICQNIHCAGRKTECYEQIKGETYGTVCLWEPGLDTTMRMQLGLYLTICGMMCLKMLTFLCTRFSLLSPSCWRTPAVTTTIRELAVTE